VGQFKSFLLYGLLAIVSLVGFSAFFLFAPPEYVFGIPLLGLGVALYLAKKKKKKTTEEVVEIRATEV
jgi:uncharacterized membrane protein (DUF4010 family)